MSLEPVPLTQETVERLRFASLAFALPPSGQRRWVQMGPMLRAREIFDNDLRAVPALCQAGELSETAADLLIELGRRFDAIRAERDDPYDEHLARPRSYMWGDTFEDDAWRELRYVARDCYRLLSEGKAPIIDD